MKTRKIISIFLSLVMVFLSLPLMSVNLFAAEYYDSSKALAYAKAHWNDGNGLCADFVSKCLTAGGISVNFSGVGDLYRNLKSRNCCTMYTLTLTKSGNNYLIRESDNKGKIAAGDPLFFYCRNCGYYAHTSLCNGFNSSGYCVDYAHNNAHDGVNNVAITWQHDCGSSSSWTIYCAHMTQTHTHSYTGEYFEAVHPHKVYKSCSCGATYYKGGTVSYLKCSTCMNVKDRHLQGYILSSSSVPVYDNINIYNRKQVATLNSNTSYYIGEVYDCGWCSIVKEATQGGVVGTARPSGSPDPNLIGYVPISTFFPENSCYTSSFNKISLKASSKLQTYRRNDLANSYVTLKNGESFTVVGYKNNAFQIIDGESYTNDYICWIPASSLTFNATYNANGGTGSMASTSVQYPNKLFVNGNEFSKKGYTFSGWNIQRESDSRWYYEVGGWCTATETTESKYTKCVYNGGTLYDMKDWINGSSTDDLFVFYATWKPNTYTISYNANGGSGSMSTSTHTYDTAKALTANAFTRSGYTFLGWSANSSATSATYTDKQSVKNLTATNGDTVTLYAVWEKNPATVSSISIQSKPTKTAYTVGETFNSNGLSIKVNMSDGTSKTVTSGFTVSSPDMTTAGTKTVTVTYSGKTATFNITVNNPVSPTAAQYKISGATATAGSTVEVYVSIENNPGIISLRNKITYDTSVMELVKVEDMKLLSGYTTPSPTVDSPYTLRWADSLATENNNANGNIVKLTFKIKDDAQTGDYSISVSHIESRTANGEKIEFADCSSVIKVMDYIPGDVDSNGEVDDWDAIVLNRYLAGWKTEVNFAAADMDGDGELTDWDAIALERRLAGWDS